MKTTKKPTLPSVTSRTLWPNNASAPLTTPDECHAIIRELENEPPMAAEEADSAIEFLLSAGLYGRPPDDFDNYLRHLIEEVSDYPGSTARSAINQLARTRKTYPSRATLHEALEDAERDRQARLNQAFQKLKTFADAARKKEEHDQRRNAHWSKKHWNELEPDEVKEVEAFLDDIMGRSKDR